MAGHLVYQRFPQLVPLPLLNPWVVVVVLLDYIKVSVYMESLVFLLLSLLLFLGLNILFLVLIILGLLLIKYCRDILITKTNLNKQEELNKSLNELERIPITNFIQIVILEFSPYQTNPSAYVLKMLNDNELKKEDLNDDEFNKLTRYIDMFIKVCN